MKLTHLSLAIALASTLLCAPAFSAPSSSACAAVAVASVGSSSTYDTVYRKTRKGGCECATDSGQSDELAGCVCK